MGTRVKIEVEVQLKNTQHVSLIEHDEVVETFTANRFNQTHCESLILRIQRLRFEPCTPVWQSLLGLERAIHRSRSE